MVEVNRVARWRERLKDAGKKAITVWVTSEEEARLKDLALTWHCSPSELVQQALAQFHPGAPSRISSTTETAQTRPVLHEELPALVAAIIAQLQQKPTVTETGHSDVTETTAIPAPKARKKEPVTVACLSNDTETKEVGRQGKTGTPDKAAVLARLQALQARGLSFGKIATQMQEDGVPTLSGRGQWQKGTVAKLLERA